MQTALTTTPSSSKPCPSRLPVISSSSACGCTAAAHTLSEPTLPTLPGDARSIRVANHWLPPRWPIFKAFEASLSRQSANTRKRTLNAVKSLLSFGQKVGYLRFNVGAA